MSQVASLDFVSEKYPHLVVELKETGNIGRKIPGVHQLEGTFTYLTKYGTHISFSCIIHVYALLLLIFLLGIRLTLLTL